MLRDRAGAMTRLRMDRGNLSKLLAMSLEKRKELVKKSVRSTESNALEFMKQAVMTYPHKHWFVIVYMERM